MHDANATIVVGIHTPHTVRLVSFVIQSTQVVGTSVCALAKGAGTLRGGIPNSAATVERGPMETFLIEKRNVIRSR